MRVADSESVAKRVRDTIRSSDARHWRVEELGDASEAKAVNDELRRLVAAGDIRRVRRGVYWRGKSTRFGMSPGSPAQAAREQMGDEEAVGAAEWYATNLLGLSTQVSPVEVLAVTRRPPSGFPRVRFVNRASCTGRRTEHLSDFEVTLLEALDAWDTHVELSPADAIRRFVVLLSQDEVRLDRLVSASPSESATARERLRALLLRMGRDELAEQVPRARSVQARHRALRVLEGA